MLFGEVLFYTLVIPICILVFDVNVGMTSSYKDY